MFLQMLSDALETLHHFILLYSGKLCKEHFKKYRNTTGNSTSGAAGGGAIIKGHVKRNTTKTQCHKDTKLFVFFKWSQFSCHFFSMWMLPRWSQTTSVSSDWPELAWVIVSMATILADWKWACWKSTILPLEHRLHKIYQIFLTILHENTYLPIYLFTSSYCGDCDK